jgi:hypothetical protein
MIRNGYLTIILILFCSSFLFAQDSVPAWGGGADQTDLSFGFTFSYVSNSYKIYKKTNWQAPLVDPATGNSLTSPLTGIGSKSLPGFGIGFITRYSLTDNLEVRITPSLIFADRELSYTFTDPSQNMNKQLQPTVVDFPLSFKLKSDRIGNFRAYILGGLKYSEQIGKGASTDANDDPLQKLVRNTSGYGSYEAGLGCDFYFEFFKLSPEIKISNSLGNVLIQDNQPFSAPISKLSLHTIMFSLYFE